MASRSMFQLLAQGVSLWTQAPVAIANFILSQKTGWMTRMRKKRTFRWCNRERLLEGHTGAEKINLGALCNVLRQFHFHVVAASPTI